MTAEPDLLPLPRELAHLTRVDEDRIETYARANVAHATAARDAEIADLMECNRSLMDALNVAELSNEALRADCLSLRTKLDGERAQVDTLHAKAERLAEALRAARQNIVTENFPIGWSISRIDEVLTSNAAQQGETM